MRRRAVQKPHMGGLYEVQPVQRGLSLPVQPPTGQFSPGVFSEFFLGRETMKVFSITLPACCFVTGWQEARAEAHLRLAPALLWLSAFSFWLAAPGTIPVELTVPGDRVSKTDWGWQQGQAPRLSYRGRITESFPESPVLTGLTLFCFVLFFGACYMWGL